MFYCNDPKDIFDGKEKSDNPFSYIKLPVISFIQGRNAFQHNQDYTKDDNNKQNHIKQLPHRGICLIYYFVKPEFPIFRFFFVQFF